MTAAAPPSGKQFSLQLGAATAVITEVGAGLRSYSVDGRELLDGYGVDQMCTGARGQTFIPWPNRIADGRYEFDGATHQLPLTEPESHNAIHGLTRWSEWHLTGGNGHSITLQTTLHASPGFPFPLRCQIRYRLHSGGLSVETRSTNIGTTPCPYATGAHPYISLGTSRIDELTVQVPARSYLPTGAPSSPAAPPPAPAARPPPPPARRGGGRPRAPGSGAHPPARARGAPQRPPRPARGPPRRAGGPRPPPRRARRSSSLLNARLMQ